MSEPVLLVDRDRRGVVRLLLNRPKAYNALSMELLARLEEELLQLADDPKARVIVVRGAGEKAFCTGHDLKEMGANRRYAVLKSLFDRCSRVMALLVRHPLPVIAAVQGIATAAGCQLVAAADLAVASEEARFATSGVKYGLFCSTPMVALSRVVPQKAALEMLFTGDFIDAREAWRLGLVNRVVPASELDQAVEDLVSRLLDKPREVLALGKQAFYRQLRMGLEEAYAYTSEVIVQNALSWTFAEGFRAFVEKRPPVWEPPRGAPREQATAKG